MVMKLLHVSKIHNTPSHRNRGAVSTMFNVHEQNPGHKM